MPKIFSPHCKLTLIEYGGAQKPMRMRDIKSMIINSLKTVLKK